MNLLQVVKHLQGIALTIPNIRSANEGSVYTIQNGNPHQKYMSFVVSQTQHRTDELFDYFGLNLFLIDRLTDELEANRLQIQSLAKDCLTNILIKFCNKFYGATYNELVFHPFTEKFTDLCAGQYVQVTLQIPRNIICEDEYTTEYLPDYTLKPLNVEITDNGIYEYTPVSEDYDGYDSVKITVNVPQTGTSINNQTKTVEVVENGDYVVEFDEGYTGLDKVNFNVDVSGYTEQDLNDAYESGITSGVSYQKSLLQDITIEHNGEYQVENGFKKVTVNVPQSGESIYNQTKSIEYSGNGEYTLTYDEGYTGLEAVNININVPQSAYTSGYTEQDLIDAYNSGITYQKSLLSAVTLTENGTYIYYNGVSAITVNVSGDTPVPPTPSGETDYRNMYLTFEVLSGGNLDWIYNEYNSYESSGGAKTIEYRINGGEWHTITAVAYKTHHNYRITANTGDIIEWKGTNAQYSNCGTPSSTSEWQNKWFAQYNNSNEIVYNVYGNILSMIYGDNFKNYTTIESAYTFSNIFGHHKVISAENLILPENTTNDCYLNMFGACREFKKAPELPARIMTNYCYAYMFFGCESLTSAPKLPSITLADCCYEYMFAACTSLTSAPTILPATILKEHCYTRMFQGCTSLTSAPELPATTLVHRCYSLMFSGCTSLNYIKCLASENVIDLNHNYLYHWVDGVASSGTFVKKSGVTWENGVSGIPDNWTVQNV